MNDLISRQAAIDYFLTNVGWHDEDGYPIEDSDELWKIWTDLFNGVPSAKPERKKGRWIAHVGGKFVGFPYMHYECDQCRAFEPTETNFCPNCGADMRGNTNGET